MSRSPFLGGYGVGRSTDVADSQLMNLYLEFTEGKNGKGPGAFYMTPGLTLLKNLGTGPVEAMHIMGSNLYVASGTHLYQITPTLTSTDLGSVGPATSQMIDNGTQLALVNGLNLHVYGPVYGISSITVDQPGLGYTSPTISFTSSTGSGATATATLNKYVSTVAVTSGGSHYSAPIVSFTDATGSGAAATATVNYGVSSLSVVSGGKNYSSPTVTITDPTGTGATATATVSGGVITALSVTSNGSNYTSPNVVISDSAGSGAVGLAILQGPISSITVTSKGVNYTAPTVHITDATGSGATLTTTLLGTITAINVTAAGSGFMAAPTVNISDSTGTGAAAHATLTATTGNAINLITLPFTFPFSLSYQDGFGLAASVLTNQIWQSNLLDLSTWDALNFSEADSTPSFIQSIAEKQREQWIFKSDCIEVWINAGLNGFSFQRLQGVFIEEGCASPYSVAKMGNALCWLSQNSQGFAKVFFAESYQPERISTHQIEYQISQFVSISDAFAYCYQQDGHEFYVLTFPTGNATFVYDRTASRDAGIPIWHQRGSGTGGSFNRHLGLCHCFFNRNLSGLSALHLIGDNSNGNIYYYDETNSTDNGAAREWFRTFRAVDQPSFTPRRFDSLQVDMTTGVNVTGSPTISLAWSDDGGNNFTTPSTISAGTSGQTAQRVKWNALGSTKKATGLDRIFQLSSTLDSSNNYQVALMGVEINP